jgi:hypothetical protein
MWVGCSPDSGIAKIGAVELGGQPPSGRLELIDIQRRRGLLGTWLGILVLRWLGMAETGRLDGISRHEAIAGERSGVAQF